ncbi:MAG: toxin [Frankiales bacterium]|nr:toxin [Frankiales bacterium]
MTRYWVSGNSGSGKTTLSAELARRLGIPHIELDGLFHQPGWGQQDTAVFVAEVLAATAGEAWVLDGNYRGRLTGQVEADVYVWLDYPRWITFPRVLRRTLRRVLLREELWNGNREVWRNVLSRDPETSILRWSWTQDQPYRQLFEGLVDERWVRLRTPRETRLWLDAVTR